MCSGHRPGLFCAKTKRRETWIEATPLFLISTRRINPGLRKKKQRSAGLSLANPAASNSPITSSSCSRPMGRMRKRWRSTDEFSRTVRTIRLLTGERNDPHKMVSHCPPTGLSAPRQEKPLASPLWQHRLGSLLQSLQVATRESVDRALCKDGDGFVMSFFINAMTSPCPTMSAGSRHERCGVDGRERRMHVEPNGP